MKVFREFDQSQLDAQYNVRAGIPDYLDIFARWKAESTEFRRAAGPKENLQYGDAKGQELDFFDSGATKAPLLVFIHGGYWQSLDKSDFSYVAAPYLSQGIDVAVVNYRLAPQVKMAEIVSDNRAAVAWLYKNADRLGFDADKLFISGHSAGGHLTAVLAGTDWTQFGLPKNAVKGGCAISGLYDLEPIRLCYLNKVIGLNEADVAQFSPLRISRGTKVPLILTVGGDESPEYFRLQGEFEHRLREEGALLEVVDLQKGHHFDAVDALGTPDHRLAKAVLKMIKGA
jgi:arylformamidase